ncbi:unnamed protein product [Rhizoctonia solani]|uniref:J domain-containing protein n=1 Tax=Rhizoctonia solani TaxID=456999 RepID=A0A8H3GF01_9AGAM|nr:unnamed protein product [Rhizoctonia solani]
MGSFTTESVNHSTPSSPAISLADFEYDSEPPPAEQPKIIRNEPGPAPPDSLPAFQGQSKTSSTHLDSATKDDVTALRQLIQHEFEQLRLQKSNLSSHPLAEVPREAFADALRAEMAVRSAKISALEEENRKLRAEKQELRKALDRAENQPGVQAELNAANQELKRVYIERQGLWDERAALWGERGDLWRERQSLWEERAIITHQSDSTQNEASPAASSSKRASGTGTPQPRKRKIGTQERPLETAYYEILGVEVTATSDDIKKAYRRLAIKHHPDKNRDDPSAEETFKQISVAYQVLSDPELRKKYNEFGPKEGAPDAAFVDPEEIFSAIFGGERFVPIIGHISLGKDMKDALQNEESDNEEPATPVQRDSKGREIISPEERARREEKRRRKEERDRQVDAQKQKARAERVGQLVTELSRKLSIYTESATGHPQQDADVANSWRQICEIEANELKGESYGVDLLNAVGFVYVAKAKHYLATNQTFMGVGGWLHNIQGKYHVFSETVSTVRSALELKQVFDQIAQAEKAGVSPEEKKKLEEQAAEKGLRALFKGAKLEIESVLRETCDRVLADPALQSSKLHLRAEALQILGEAYLSVKKDGDAPEDDYVRVETNASRQRAASAGYA